MRPLPTLLASSLLILTALAPAPLATAQGAGTATVVFDEQASGGHAVLVKTVTLSQGGFVAIHDETLLSGNTLGSVIGLSPFLAAGEHKDVRVYLNRSLAAPNETLIAMPHKDTNGNRLYDFVTSNGADDGPFTGGSGPGGIVLSPATVTVSAALGAGKQTTSGKSMIVDFFDSKEGGFIAVHDKTLLDGQVIPSVVGFSNFLEPGIHRNVHVSFNVKPATSGPLIPMAHKDTNGNKVYDFISSNGAADGPYTGATGTPNGIVLQPVEVTFSQNASVTFKAQSTGGRVVFVEQVFLPEPGFVAIHDSSLVSEQDATGSVVGVSGKLGPGLHRNVTVRLDKPLTVANDTLIAMPHKDTNNNGVYDFVTSNGQQDGPFLGGPAAQQTFAGNIVIQGAAVNRTAGVRIVDQVSANGGTVTVAYADLAEPGFVALHDASLLAGQVIPSVVGVSAKLNAGFHENVQITLTRPLNATTTLIAMPHKDTNNNNVYDFVTSNGADDGPFTGGTGPNNIVVSLATVVKAGASGSLPAIRAGDVLSGAFAPGNNNNNNQNNNQQNNGGNNDSGNNDSDTPGFTAALLAVGAAVAALLTARRRRQG